MAENLNIKEKKNTEEKEKSKSKEEAHDVDRRKFIEKSARDLGACGFAIFELAKTIKNEIIQEVVNDIKDVIKRP
jgi:hypothetical protein